MLYLSQILRVLVSGQAWFHEGKARGLGLATQLASCERNGYPASAGPRKSTMSSSGWLGRQKGPRGTSVDQSSSSTSRRQCVVHPTTYDTKMHQNSLPSSQLCSERTASAKMMRSKLPRKSGMAPRRCHDDGGLENMAKPVLCSLSSLWGWWVLMGRDFR